jgi:hypothetical protein
MAITSLNGILPARLDAVAHSNRATVTAFTLSTRLARLDRLAKRDRQIAAWLRLI